MPNVLDAEPMRAFVRRVVGKIGDEKIAARFRRMAFDRLMADLRNFRAARPDEIETGPEWAKRAHARGEPVHVFVLHRSASSRLHLVARRLGDTCKMAATDDATRPRDIGVITAAREFLDKFNRASFDVAARKALYFSRMFAGWADDSDSTPVCEEQIFSATQGRVWWRVRSLGELRAVGREFRNCLARTTRAGSYGGMLLQGLAQFWVLRDARGVGLIVAMAPAPEAAYFSEVRGPRNAPIYSDHVDLMRLAAAIGMTPREPPARRPPAGAAAFGQAPMDLEEIQELRRLLLEPLRVRTSAP